VTEAELRARNIIYKGCVARNTKAYGFDTNETRDVLNHGCRARRPEQATAATTARGISRADAKQKKPPIKDWVLDNVTIEDFTVLDGNTFVFTGSNSGEKPLDLGKHRVQIISPRAADGSPAK
jgi:hypothetical protein